MSMKARNVGNTHTARGGRKAALDRTRECGGIVVYARHDLIGDKHRFIYPDSSIRRTRQRIRDEHQQALHSIDPLQLLEEPEVQKRVCLPIGQQDRLNLGARLPVDLLDQRELLRGDEVRALVALRWCSLFSTLVHMRDGR